MTPVAPAPLACLIRAALLLACITVAGAGLAQGQAGSGPVKWSQLSPAQRSVLTPLERDWASISPARQQKWAEVANRFPAMPADERSRVQQRIAEWSGLSPQERASTRLNFQEARQISPDERRQQWETYRALPADERRALAESATRQRPASAASATPRRPDTDARAKSSVVRAPAAAAPQPVGPMVVRRGTGATTNLVSKPAAPPLHQQAGLPKVAATPGFVDSATLLPKRGAQGAAARAPTGDGEQSTAQ